MKSLAWSFVWWPGMDKAIAEKVKSCNSCQQMQHLPNKAPLHPWDWPERPWSRLHVDYAGPFLGRMFLITIDAHSKWIDAKPVSAATSDATIEHLRSLFSNYGIPETLVSDNGTAFTSSKFEELMARNSIRPIKVAPYHPSSLLKELCKLLRRDEEV